MTNLREAYAATAYASLSSDPNSERPVDRVAASGFAESLGVLLWRTKYQLEGTAYREARKGLVALYRAKISQYETHGIVEAIVDQCLHEYLSDACETCYGKKEMVSEQLRIICPACGGTGIRRHTDRDRAGRMKISIERVQSKRMQSNFRKMLEAISTMDAEVNRVMVQQLERGDRR